MPNEKKKSVDKDPLSSHLYREAKCANCSKEISEKRLEQAKKDGWLPLCEKCDKFLRKQLEKCKPLMEKLMG